MEDEKCTPTMNALPSLTPLDETQLIIVEEWQQCQRVRLSSKSGNRFPSHAIGTPSSLRLKSPSPQTTIDAISRPTVIGGEYRGSLHGHARTKWGENPSTCQTPLHVTDPSVALYPSERQQLVHVSQAPELIHCSGKYPPGGRSRHVATKPKRYFSGWKRTATILS